MSQVKACHGRWRHTLAEEVIDLLGKEAGCEEKQPQITSQAKCGELDFETSLRARVAFVKRPLFRSLILSSKSIHLSRILRNLSPYFKGHSSRSRSGGFTQWTKDCKIPWYFLFLHNQLGSKTVFNRKISWWNCDKLSNKLLLRKWKKNWNFPKKNDLTVVMGLTLPLDVKVGRTWYLHLCLRSRKIEIACHVDTRDFGFWHSWLLEARELWNYVHPILLKKVWQQRDRSSYKKGF